MRTSMTYKTYYLAFNAPLHVGNHKPESYEQSEDFLRSDTIVAAIYAAWAKMGNVDWIPSDGNPPFTVSSAFPYVETGKNEYVHFFPRPKVRFNRKEEQNSDGSVRKKIKKVQWLDQEYFESVINHREMTDYGVGNKDLKGNYLSGSNINPEEHITKDLIQRVTISRNTEEPKDSEPFYMERIFFDRAGLYFMASGENLESLEKALIFLQHEGFGTDRNVGNGFFDLKSGSIDIAVPDKSEFMTNLSLYTPESKEEFVNQISHQDTAFEAIKRGGWITTQGYQSVVKKTVMMFTEGGVWYHNKAINGIGNIDLTPSDYSINHKIWRSGRSLFVPIKA